MHNNETVRVCFRSQFFPEIEPRARGGRNWSFAVKKNAYNNNGFIMPGMLGIYLCIAVPFMGGRH